MSKREGIQKRLDEAQNEYHEILHDIFTHNTERRDEDRNYIYWWERQKKLQQQIIILTFIDREMALEKAKEALEEAFTPRIKAMLSKKIQDEISEDG
jgi:chaperonin GroEL (HSP60 family)|tara:strand:+ start:477 stop:767 length:291 start_codon:yes stop_codon:yes gene_type:complete